MSANPRFRNNNSRRRRSSAIAAAVVEAMEPRMLLADPSFVPMQEFATGASPISVAVADLNGDHKPDLVVANHTGNTVSVLLGNGDGTFMGQTTLAVGKDPESVAIADLNGDAKPDIVVPNSLDDNVGVLLGNGDGTFQTQRTFAVGHTPGSFGYSPNSVAVGDMNRDGHLDLVTSNYMDDSVSVLLGNGDGTFQEATTFDVASKSGPSSATLADLDGDGNLDLVAAYSNKHKVLVLRGNGDGTFPLPSSYECEVTPVNVAVGDLNADGKPDIVVTYLYGVTVLLGNGNTSFQDHVHYDNYLSTGDVAIADVNGDGVPDLAAVQYKDNTNRIQLLLGRGDGTFYFGSTLATGNNPNSVASADLNGDAKPDLVVTNWGSNTVGVFLNSTVPPGPDLAAPTPNPSTFATPPAWTGSAIRMVATTATDPSGVQYFFGCTAGPGHDSGWQD
ncbi:MAG: VCBS repeat-containing protein, partial [Planctomycetota bacterium]|nr:VCBS repeat-containing protein [Planctomycetota bacterium]